RARGLGEPYDAPWVAYVGLVHTIDAVDDLDVLRGLAGGSLDLLVPLVADEQDVVVLGREALGLVVHLGDQRAGGVDRAQVAAGGLLVHGGRDAVGGEHDDGPLGHLIGLLDEDRAL